MFLGFYHVLGNSKFASAKVHKFIGVIFLKMFLSHVAPFTAQSPNTVHFLKRTKTSKPKVFKWHSRLSLEDAAKTGHAIKK